MFRVPGGRTLSASELFDEMSWDAKHDKSVLLAKMLFDKGVLSPEEYLEVNDMGWRGYRVAETEK